MIPRWKISKYLNDVFAGSTTCQQFTEVITDYLEGALTTREWIRFQIHLGLCIGCRRYLRQMKQSIHVLDKLPDEAIPIEIHEEMLRKFETWTSQENTPPPS
jgi:hypothetical protein